MTEIYINDRKLEIDNPKTIGLTFQASGFLNSGASGFLTNSFKVPKTKENNITLNNITNLNSDSNAPYERNTAKIIQYGIEIVTDGFAIITNTDDNYNVAIYSGNVSFFELIKNKNVNELNWTAYDHVYNITNILASYSNTTGLMYPIIDFGNGVQLLNNSTLQNADAFLPTIFGSTLLELIITTAGLSLIGTFKDSDYYDKLIVTPNRFGWTEGYGIAVDGNASDVTPIAFHQDTIESSLTASGATEIVEVILDYNTFTNPSFAGVGSPPLPTYTNANVIYGTLVFFFKSWWAGVRATGCSWVLNAVIYEDGVAMNTSSPYHASGSYSTSPSATNFAQNRIVPITTGIVALKAASVYTVRLWMEVERHATIDQTLGSVLYSSSFSVAMSSHIPYGATLNFKDLWDIEQDKIISDILKMFNLVSQTNNTTKEISFNFLDDLIENKKVAKDWSSKVDWSKKISVKYKADGFGQTNNYKYAEDELVFNDSANGTITVADNNLELVKDIVTLNATSSIKVTRVSDNDTPSIPFMNAVGQIFEKQKSRYLLLDKKTLDLDLQNTVNADTGSATTNIPFVYFKKDGKTDNLDFPTLITNHYVATMAMLNQFKYVSAYFKLNELDVVDFDFTIPVYLDISDGKITINGFFYVNKISNFKQDASTNCELIRL